MHVFITVRVPLLVYFNCIFFEQKLYACMHHLHACSKCLYSRCRITFFFQQQVHNYDTLILESEIVKFNFDSQAFDFNAQVWSLIKWYQMNPLLSSQWRSCETRDAVCHLVNSRLPCTDQVKCMRLKVIF